MATKQITAQGVLGGVDCKFQIPADQAERFANMMSRLGYKFVDCNSLR